MDPGSTLSKLYYTPELPSAYGGIAPLYREAKKHKISLKTVKDWLSTQRVYTLHRPVRYHFPRNRVLCYGRDEQWQADLIDLSSLARFNDNYRYILITIDVLSKYAFAVPLKTKTQDEVIQAFGTILAEGRVPSKVLTDAGGEFGPKFQKFLLDKGIKHFIARNEDIKASLAERFIKTLKLRLFRYFTYRGEQKFLSVLPKIMESYNKSFHRSIGMTPSDVNSEDQAAKAHRNLYKGTTLASAPPPALKVGDHVRLALHKHAFSRSFNQLWTEEIFKIASIHKRKPNSVYTVNELNGDPITGKFYAHELEKVKDDGTYTVEQVLKTRKGRGGRTEYFVKWKGYPSTYNSWTSDLWNLNEQSPSSQPN